MCSADDTPHHNEKELIEMIINERLTIKIYNLIRSNKRISKLGFSCDELGEYFNTINYINYCMKEDTTLIGNTNIDKYRISKLFDDFILPYRITASGSKKENQLRNLQSSDFEFLDVEDFNDVTDAISSAFKGKVEDINLKADDREPGAIADYITRELSRDGELCYSGNYCFPIPFKITFNKKSRLNEDAYESVYYLVESRVKSVPN